MSDFPKFAQINEEGPSEGFQFEKGPIPTERKIELIAAAQLAEDIVGHPLPGSVKMGGSLSALREKMPG